MLGLCTEGTRFRRLPCARCPEDGKELEREAIRAHWRAIRPLASN